MPEVLILVGGRIEDHQRVLAKVELVTTRPCAWCMPHESQIPIYVGRGFRLPLGELWARTKSFN